MSRARDRDEHRGHTYEDQMMSATTDDGIDSEGDLEGFPCRYCKTPVYWGDHYNSTGEPGRRLFTASNRRLHACGSKLDPDAFAAVPE
jgi:hypothetical protein